MRSSIFDVKGALVHQLTPVASTAGWDSIDIPCPASPGAYFVHVVAGHDRVVLPFVVR